MESMGFQPPEQVCQLLTSGKTSGCCIGMMAESPIKFFKAHGFDILFLSLITSKGSCLITMAELGNPSPNQQTCTEGKPEDTRDGPGMEYDTQLSSGNGFEQDPDVSPLELHLKICILNPLLAQQVFTVFDLIILQRNGLRSIPFSGESGPWRGSSDLPCRLVSSVLPGRSVELTAKSCE
ncbi:Cilia- and flagella-associated protein 36 [Manis javanica]|nr:Cilia- and flagella-associated protein 36 [Manis javanica]